MHQWTPEQISRFWEYESKESDQFWSKIHGKQFIKFIYKKVAFANTFLDYGCGGNAHLLQIIASDMRFTGKTLVGYEPSGVSFSDATISNKFSSHLSLTSSFEDLSSFSESGHFDCIFCCEVIEHLYDDQLVSLLQKLSSLLSSKGVVVFTTPFDEDLDKSMIYNPIDGSLFHRWQHVRSWDLNTINNQLLPHFTHLDIYPTNLSWYDSLPKSIYRRLRYKDLPNLVVLASK